MTVPLFNPYKTKLIKINAKSDEQVTNDNNNIEEVQEFVYLGSKTKTDGNSKMDVPQRLSKARGAFAALQNIQTLGAESWKVVQSVCHNNNYNFIRTPN